MKLTVLVDNNTLIDKYYIGEPGLSFHIEDGKKSILFDTGYSDIVISNAKALNIDLSTVSNIVISHGHNDHTGGLRYLYNDWYLKNKRIIAHPYAFNNRIEYGQPIGSPICKNDLNQTCELLLSKEPVKITNNITFLGEIPEKYEYETRKPMGIIHDGKTEYTDYVLDDTALVYQNDQGLFIITACSHSGICNIIDYAKQVCKDKRILGVIGGFHLFNADEKLNKTIEYFKSQKIKHLYPCHCVSLKAKCLFNNEIPIGEIGVSSTIEL